MHRLLNLFVLTAAVAAMAAAMACSSSDNSKEVKDLQQKVDALTKAIVVNDDGSARFVVAAPVAVVTYKDYGFGLPMPQSVKVTAAGLNGKDANKDSGSVVASSGGTSLLLVWTKADPPLSPEESVNGAFNVMQRLTQQQFEPAGSGQGLKVDSQSGAFGTFVARDTVGNIAGVGVIGGWVCPKDNRSFALTVTGQQLDPVKQSFVYLTDGFKCAA